MIFGFVLTGCGEGAGGSGYDIYLRIHSGKRVVQQQQVGLTIRLDKGQAALVLD